MAQLIDAHRPTSIQTSVSISPCSTAYSMNEAHVVNILHNHLHSTCHCCTKKNTENIEQSLYHPLLWLLFWKVSQSCVLETANTQSSMVPVVQNNDLNINTFHHETHTGTPQGVTNTHTVKLCVQSTSHQQRYRHNDSGTHTVTVWATLWGNHFTDKETVTFSLYYGTVYRIQILKQSTVGNNNALTHKT